jgi:hypothetical protein
MRSNLSVLAAAAAAAVLGAPVTTVRAQDTARPPGSEPAVCLGFAFGAFTPKLDWAKAGHAPIRDSSAVPRAPDGRDWASDVALPNDSSLYLFPSWWPVGVWIQLSSRAPAAGDTATGRAIALVARGNISPPVAPVKAWRVPCGRPAARPAAQPVPTAVPDSVRHRTRPKP